MKKILIVLLFVPLILGLIGCQTAQTPSVTKHTSFLGVDLGMSKSEVESILGAGTYLGMDYTLNLEQWMYGSPPEADAVDFNTDGAVIILTNRPASTIENISKGDSLTHVTDTLGQPSTTTNPSSDYTTYWYSNRNIRIVIRNSTNTVSSIGIYNSSIISY